ncbi:MAG TPA: tetratricopeptide repeat protein, partial [Vicinamibacterales bacterium]|nr:tetratricopeptide repeat protein [Vicinamibacterales bacterium]
VLAASAAAVLFAVHPLMSSAVAYVSGRSELLCGVFFAAGLLCARSAMSRGDLTRPDTSPARPAVDRHRFAGALAILLGAFAVLSKEVAVVLPLVVLAYDWLVLPASPAVRRRRFWTVFVPILSLMAVAAAFRLATLSAVGGGTAAAPLQSILTHSIVIWRYLGLLILPIGQSIMHGVRTVTAPTDPVGLIACGALVAAVAMAIRFRRAEPLAAFGIVWFVAAIAPSSSFVALREGMAEHRVYVASAGLLAAFGALSRRALVRMAGASPRAPVGYISVVLVVASVLSALTLARNNVWADPVRLWSEAVVHAPGMWEPLYALGDALRTAGRCPEAVPEYERVVAIKPDHRDAHTNLGICLGESGRLREAEASFRRVLEIDPRSARAYSNLGAVALLAGEPDRARDFYVQAIAADPRAVLARMQLAHLYEKTYHDYHAAARLCGEARAIDPATRGVIECVERNQKLAAAADQGR